MPPKKKTKEDSDKKNHSCVPQRAKEEVTKFAKRNKKGQIGISADEIICLIEKEYGLPIEQVLAKYFKEVIKEELANHPKILNDAKESR